MKENNATSKTIKEILGLVANGVSTIYVIVLFLSISYNIGYFKQVNPQIIDLFEIIDYINDTIHNIGFLLLGVLLFFSSSLAFVVIKVRNKLYEILAIGIFAFIVSGYLLMEGIYYSKFWPIIRQLGNISSMIIIVISLLLVLIMIFILIYRTSIKVIANNENINNYSIGIAPIIIFLLLVLMPYIVGLTHGYIDNKYITKEDYDNVHTVNIDLVDNNEELKNVAIIKKLSKGVVIIQFKEKSKDKIIFLNWGSIKAITYKEVEAYTVN